MPRKKKGSFASPFDDMEWENEEHPYVLPYKISKTRVWRRGQLFLEWKASMWSSLIIHNTYWTERKKAEASIPFIQPLYLACNAWDQVETQHGVEKKNHMPISFFKWCFAVNWFLFNLAYAKATLPLVRQHDSWNLQHEQDQPVHFLVAMEYLEYCPLWIVLVHESNYPHNQWRLYIGTDWVLLLNRLLGTLK